ncbi:MAG: putative transcriptional regulator [Acidimicrobiia bacterium]|nr:putative transcriptional regulator [Acidimicrobiia bacterium]
MQLRPTWWTCGPNRSYGAGTYRHDRPDLVSGWHCHNLHQIEYASRGVAEIESAGGLLHRTTLNGVRSIAVFSIRP